MTLSKFLKAPTEQVPGLISSSWDITDHEHYWYKQGTTNYALVAHIDTLAPLKINLQIDKFGFVFNKHGILGADDRNGCWIISELKHFNPHIFLFNYEELGGIGVRQFFQDQQQISQGIEYFLEFDRKGVGEFVYYSNYTSKKLIRWAEMFGLSEGCGSFSDVSVITEKTNIPHLNLSAGFIHEHSVREAIHFASMPKLVNRYRRMLQTAPKRVKKLKPIVHKPLIWKWSDSYWNGKDDLMYMYQ